MHWIDFVWNPNVNAFSATKQIKAADSDSDLYWDIVFMYSMYNIQRSSYVTLHLSFLTNPVWSLSVKSGTNVWSLFDIIEVSILYSTFHIDLYIFYIFGTFPYL